MVKTILVTGANGFVGHHLVKELHDNGYRVISTGREASDQLTPYVDEHHVLDLTDPKAVLKLNFKDIDGVIHLAGLAAVGPSFDAPLDYININMGMEVNLYEAARAQGTSARFIIVSSGSLYNPKAHLPLTETSSVQANSPYAVSKLGQEQLAAYYGNRGFEYIIVRPFNHIGPGQNLGFLLPDLTKQIIDVKQGRAKEVLVGNLDAARDYTDVRDIARAYRLLFEKGVSGETYNICSGQALTGNEILDKLVKISKTKVEIKPDPTRMRPSDTPVIYGSHDKLTKDTGWKPQTSIDTSVTDIVADWRQRPANP